MLLYEVHLTVADVTVKREPPALCMWGIKKKKPNKKTHSTSRRVCDIRTLGKSCKIKQNMVPTYTHKATAVARFINLPCSLMSSDMVTFHSTGGSWK